VKEVGAASADADDDKNVKGEIILIAMNYIPERTIDIESAMFDESTSEGNSNKSERNMKPTSTRHMKWLTVARLWKELWSSSKYKMLTCLRTCNFRIIQPIPARRFF